MLVGDAYLFGLLQAPLVFVAPVPLFLPQAVILSALLLTPPRRWWLPLVVYSVYLLVHALLRGNPLWHAAGVNVADLIEPLVGAILIRALVPGSAEFSRLTSVSAYVACVTVGAILSATWASTVRIFLGAAYWDSWSTWFLSDVLSSLAVAPLILLWARAGRSGLRAQSRARFLEAAALVSAFVLLGALGLANYWGSDVERALQLYAPVPVLIWAAMRFGPRGVSSGLSAVIVLSVTTAANDWGPGAETNLLTVRVFLFAIGLPLFALAALMEEQQTAQEYLEESEDRYHKMVSNLPGSVLLFDAQLRYVFADGQGLSDLGLSKGAVEGKSLWEVFPRGMAAVLEPHYRAALIGAHDSFALPYNGRIYQTEVLPVSAAGSATGMMLV